MESSTSTIIRLEELAELLSKTLSDDNSIRSKVESSLDHLSKHCQTFGVQLSQIISSESHDLAIRHSAGIALSRYILNHWSPFFTSFIGFTPPLEIKHQIRYNILQHLGIPSRKLRSTCALIISEIAHCDWPEEWPDLIPTLITNINDHNQSSILKDGSLRVLSELIRNDLSEQQLMPIAKDLLPCLFSVVSSSTNHYDTETATIKITSLSIFRQCLITLTIVKSTYRDLTSSVTLQLLPNWLHLFKHLLTTTDTQQIHQDLNSIKNWIGINCEIMRCLDVILNGFYNAFRQAELLRSDSLSSFVESSFSSLNFLFPIYQESLLISSEITLASTLFESGDHSNQDPIFAANNILRYPSTVLNFLKNVIEKPISKKLFLNSNSNTSSDIQSSTPALEILIEFVFKYSQITRVEEEGWKDDENCFVVDYLDEDESFSGAGGSTNRQAAVDLLETLIEVLGQPALTAITNHLPMASKTVSELKSQGVSHWWKSMESVLTVLGNLASEFQGQGNVHSNIAEFIERDVLSLLTCESNPLIQGRSFIFISQFKDHLSEDQLQQVIKYCSELFISFNVSSSGDDNHDNDGDLGKTMIKLCLIKALRNFARSSPTLVKPHSYTILGQLLQILPNAADAISITVVETIHRVCEPILNELQSDVLETLADCVLAHLSDNVSDHLLVDAVNDLFTMLSTSTTPQASALLSHKLLPHLGNLLRNTDSPSTTQSKSYLAIKASTVAIIDGIFKGKCMPLSDGMFDAVAVGVFATLVGSEDSDLIQDCLNILTSVVRKGTDQLINWRNPIDHQTGMDHLVRSLAHILDPQRAESAGLFVGDLILHLLRRSKDSIVGVLPDLLKTLANRLAIAKTASFSQHADTVLDLLESFNVTAPNGEEISASQVVLSTWCENADTFQGFWNIRVSTVALSQLFTFNRPSLDCITVKGDLIITERNVNTIMTRAKAKANPDQFQAIPLRAKILKILVGELQSLLAEKARVEGAGDDDLDGLDDDDDEDEDWEDDVQDLSSKSKKEILHLSDMLGPSAKYIMSDDDDAKNEAGVEDEDEDLKEDSLYSLDLLNHLQDFFRHICERNVGGFQEISSRWLSAQELSVLQSVVSA